MNCTKHFDLGSSLTARFTICWVCRLYFSGLVCSVLSLDECLTKINYGRFFVAPRKLCRLAWHRVRLICNVRRCFYWTTIFLWKMAQFSLWWVGCDQFHGEGYAFKTLFTWRWGTPGRWGNPPSHGRKIKRVNMHSYNPGVLGWGFLRLLLCLQLRSLSRGVPSSHLEKDESLILGYICIYSWKRHALCYAVFGFARSFLPWKRPRLGGLPPPWHVYMANCHPGWQFTLPGRPGNPPRRVTSPTM